MDKNTFKVVQDPDTDIAYLTHSSDEATKNHQETDSDIISGHMPEMPGNKYCVLKSYLTYKYSLDPTKEYLWQKPRMKEFPANRKGVWYGPQCVGHNLINSFVTKLGESCGMKEKNFTNHSLQVTAITALTRQNFSNKQIMSLTGHKSTTSLAIYQKVNSDEKLRMGFALGYALVNNNIPQLHNPEQILPIKNQEVRIPQPLPAIAIQHQNVVENKENVTEENALVPFHYEPEDPLQDVRSDVPNFDLMELLSDVQNDEITVSQFKPQHRIQQPLQSSKWSKEIHQKFL